MKFYEFCSEKDEETGKQNDDEGLTFSIRTWLDVFANVNRMAKPKLNMTVQQMLYSTDSRKVKNMAKKENVPPAEGDEVSLFDALKENPDVIGEASNHGIEYRVDEESGAEIATYKKREVERVTLRSFEEEYGNSGLFCDNCMVNSRCPKYAPGYACAFNFAPDDTGDLFGMIDMLIKTQQERVNRAMFMEKMEGGQPNKIFTYEMSVLQQMLKLKADLIMASKTKSVQLSISYNETDMTGGGQQGGGVMKMLGDLLGAPKEVPAAPPVAEPIEVKTSKKEA